MNTQERSDGAALFDGLPMPVCLVDADWRLVAMNPSALSFWGMEPLLGGRRCKPCASCRRSVMGGTRVQEQAFACHAGSPR